MEDLHCSTEIVAKKEIRKSQTIEARLEKHATWNRTWPLDRRDSTVMAKRIFSDISTLNYRISANKKYLDKVLKCECMRGLNLPKKSSGLSKTQ